MTSAADEIQALQQEAAKKQAEAERLQKMAAAFPDLQRYEGRWKKIVHYSASVNEQCTNYDARHNCGCCLDSPLEIWPYMETEFGPVYSSPSCFMVGERDPYRSGDKPWPGWDQEMRKAKIPEAIIERVSSWFRKDEDKEPYDDGSPEEDGQLEDALGRIG